MERVWLSSTYYLDPSVLELSEGAEVLFTRTIAYCGAAETFGIITETGLKTLNIRALNRKKSELLSVGLMTEIEPGKYQLKGWAHWQKNGDDLLKRRKADADRKRKQREKEAEQSRDKSQMSRGRIEENRREETSTHVDQSSYVGTAGVDVHPGGPSANFESWQLVRAAIPAEHPQAVKADLAMRANALLVGGTDPATITAALALWLSKPNLGPSTLPSLVSEVLKNRNPTNGGTRVATSTLRVAAAQSLKRPEWGDSSAPKELEL